MIPYDELCEALARWRSRKGLVNGPSAHPPRATALSYQGESVATTPVKRVAVEASGDRTLTNVQAAPAPEELPPAPDMGSDADEGPTGQLAAAPRRGGDEITGELDIDSVDLIDEHEV